MQRNASDTQCISDPFEHTNAHIQFEQRIKRIHQSVGEHFLHYFIGPSEAATRKSARSLLCMCKSCVILSRYKFELCERSDTTRMCTMCSAFISNMNVTVVVIGAAAAAAVDAFVFIPYRTTDAAIPICVEKRERGRKRTHSVLPMVFSYFQICHILISINLSMEWRNDICQCRHVSNLIFSAFSMWFAQNVNFLPHFQYVPSHCHSVPMCSLIPCYFFHPILIAHVKLYTFIALCHPNCAHKHMDLNIERDSRSLKRRTCKARQSY